MSLSGAVHWVLHPIASWRFWRGKRRAMSAWNRMSGAERERHTDDFVAFTKKLGGSLSGTDAASDDETVKLRGAVKGAVKRIGI